MSCKKNTILPVLVPFHLLIFLFLIISHFKFYYFLCFTCVFICICYGICMFVCSFSFSYYFIIYVFNGALICPVSSAEGWLSMKQIFNLYHLGLAGKKKYVIISLNISVKNRWICKRIYTSVMLYYYL